MGIFVSIFFSSIPKYINDSKLNLDADEEFKKLILFCDDQIYSFSKCSDNISKITTKLSVYRPLYIKTRDLNLTDNDLVDLMLTYDQQVLCIKFKNNSIILWYDESLSLEQKGFFVQYYEYQGMSCC